MVRRNVTAHRWEHGWELWIDGEAATQVHTLDQAEQQVRDYLDTVDPEIDHNEWVIEVVPAISTYTVTAERSGKWWVLQAKEAPGAICQVARLDQAEQIREAIAFVTGQPESKIKIEIEIIPPIPPAAEQEFN